MKNPWLQIPDSPPYVLEVDRPHVEAFNALIAEENPTWRLDTDLYPEPFFGDRSADVLILARNPGIDAGDHEAHLDPRFLAAMRGNLLDGPEGHVVHALQDQFIDTPAARWWRMKLRSLIKHCGSAEELARRLFVVEFHGYHAHNWHSIGITLPSQRYGFELVASAIERGATIVCTRGWTDWAIAVPALRTYGSVYRLNSNRNAAVSEGNLGPTAFGRVLDALG